MGQKSSLLALAITVIAAPLLAQQPTAKPPAQPAAQHASLDRIVAIVGDQPITRFDLEQRILQEQQRGAQPPTDSAGLRAYELQTLNTMIDEELLLQKAKDLKVEVPDNDLNNTVDKQIRDVKSRFPTEAQFRTELAKAGLGTPEEYRKMLMDQMRRDQTMQHTMQKLREDNKIIPANVTDADVKEAFERSKASLPRRPATVTFRQIVIAPKPTAINKELAKAKAESILAEIKKGGDFALLAKRESMDPTTKETGGDLGWARRGQYVTEFENWVWHLPPGELSPVFESPFGYHIVRVDRVAAGEVKARHILIRPKLDSADLVRAKAEADSVAKAWKAGVSFDSLAKKHHDYAAKEETSILDPMPRDSLPESYQKAFAQKSPNEIVVFEIPDPQRGVPKVVVAQLLSSVPGGEYELKEMQQMIRNRLSEEGGVRKYLDSLRKGTYVSIRLDQPLAGASSSLK
ncbi:MAG TPA: peptidylprolyl isomerase [Gemmatimonadaceae bacterium]|nr:peptidylprolyl isomerase [Gemmatimonadaceae bacterium]